MGLPQWKILGDELARAVAQGLPQLLTLGGNSIGDEGACEVELPQLQTLGDELAREVGLSQLQILGDEGACEVGLSQLLTQREKKNRCTPLVTTKTRYKGGLALFTLEITFSI